MRRRSRKRFFGEAEVLDKYKIEDKGRGAPLEWRRVRRSKK